MGTPEGVNIGGGGFPGFGPSLGPFGPGGALSGGLVGSIGAGAFDPGPGGSFTDFDPGVSLLQQITAPQTRLQSTGTGNFPGGFPGGSGSIFDIFGLPGGGGNQSDGNNGFDVGGLLTGLLGSLLGGSGGGLGIGGSGGGGGTLGNLATILGPLLGLGAAAFGDDTTTQKVRVPPLSADELGLLGINKELALRQLQAFQQQQGNVNQGQSFISDLYQQMIDSQRGASDQNSQLTQKIIADGRQDAINNNTLSDRLYTNGLYQDFLSGGRASADQLANIQGAADSAISQGLSDIGRFRDEGLNNVRLNSATRGLRPEDTPIQNDFANVAQESNRLANNLVTDIRGQQFQQNLNFPLAANAQRLQQGNTALTQNLQRTTLQEELARLAQQSRLGFGAQLNANNLGLVPNQSPLGVSGQLGNRLTGNQTITNNGSQRDTLLDVASGLGGLGNSGLFGR